VVRYIAENEEDEPPTIHEPPPAAYLVLLANGRISHSFPLRGEIQLGRDKNNGVVIADHKVSRHHAYLTPIEDTFILTDQGSANGTYLNGVLISQPTRLKDKDRISLGDTVFIFTAQSPDSNLISQPALSPARPVLTPSIAPLVAPTPALSFANKPLWMLIGCLGLTIVGLLLALAVLLGLFIGRAGVTGVLLIG
jgi:hypothetical protein